MATIIDATYFDNPEVNIPTGSFDRRGDVISRWEFPLLTELFGYELAKIIQEYVDGSGVGDFRLDYLLDGREFIYGGETIRWHGLRTNVSGAFPPPTDEKISIIAYHCYYWWHRKTVTKSSNDGEIKILSENSQPVSPALKLQNAWTQFAHQRDVLFAYMYENKADYPEWNPASISCENVNAFDL